MLADRAQIREAFFRAWEKYRAQAPLAGAEKLIVDVATRHPEYHALLQDRRAVEPRFAPPDAASAFLHMGLHIALEEQLALDRPPGVRALFAELAIRTGDPHRAQHGMMECLRETLATAQARGEAPDEKAYFECLRAVRGPD